MKRFDRRDFRALVGLIVAFLAGCQTTFDKLANTMDRMASAEAEYGTMGISSPVLALPDKNFAFNLTAGADNFYQDAKSSRQGSVTELQQSALSAGLGLNASFDPAAGAGFLAQLQQYQQAAANNNAAQSFTNLKNGLQNSAAYTQYQADLQAANANTDPTAKANAIAVAQSKLASSLAGPTPTTLPSFPTSPTPAAPTTNLVSRPTDLLQMFANGGNFAGNQGLRATPPTLGINDRTALLTAGGDNATRAMFAMLGDPQLLQQFKDKKVLFEVCTVSIQPGWRTQKGFAADVETYVNYGWAPARPAVFEQYIKDPAIPVELRDALKDQEAHNVKTLRQQLLKLPNREKFEITADSLGKPPRITVRYGYGPHVAVISPLTDTQTLDLQSSDRKEREVSLSLTLAAQLAAAGLSGQAQSFLKYAESLQQDFATISPDVVINAYSSGSVFGFQVGPRLRAVDNPQMGKASGPAAVLDRQSFPALVIFGIEQQAFFPAAYWNEQKSRYELYEPILVQQSINRWVPARKRTGLENVIGLDWVSRALMQDRQPYPSERDILSFSKDLDDLLPSLDADDIFPGDGPNRLQQLAADIRTASEDVDIVKSRKTLAERAVQKASEAVATADQLREAKAQALRQAQQELEIAKQKLAAMEKVKGQSVQSQEAADKAQHAVTEAEGTLRMAQQLDASAQTDADTAQVELIDANKRLQSIQPDLKRTEDALQIAKNRLKFVTDQKRFLGNHDSTLDLAQLRVQGLKTQLFGGKTQTYMPLQVLRLGGAPTVASVEPASVSAGNMATIAVVGSDLDDVDLNKIHLVVGDVDPSGAGLQPPYSASFKNGVIFLQFTPNVLPIRPRREEFRSNVQQAKANFDQLAGYPKSLASDLGNALTAIDKGLGGVSMSDHLDRAEKVFKIDVNATIDLLNAEAAAAQFDETWCEVQASPWITSEKERIAAAFEAVKNSAAKALLAAPDAIKSAMDQLGAPNDANPTAIDPRAVTAVSSALNTFIGQVNVAFATRIATVQSSLTSLQKAQDLQEAAISLNVLDRNWKVIQTQLWTSASQALADFYQNSVDAQFAKAAQGNATLSGDVSDLDTKFAALKAAMAATNGTKPPDAQASKDITAAIAKLQGDMLSLLGPTVHAGPGEATLHPDEIEALQAKAIGAAVTQQEAIKAPLKRAGSPLSTDEQIAKARARLINVTAAIRIAGAIDPKSVNVDKEAIRLAKENLDEARSVYDQVRKAVGDGTGDASAASLLAAAEANVLAARGNLAQLETDVEQTLVFALPSKSDPTAMAYTPQIKVAGSDPSDLVIAPQVVQLQSGGASGSGAAASSSSGSNASSSGQNVNVLIAGNGLNKVDLANITSVPVSKQPLSARLVGNSIAITINISSADSAIYFDFPIMGSARHVATPPITVKAAATASGGTTGTGGTPSVTAVSPQSLTLASDQNNKPIASFSVPILLAGPNLDQADLSSLIVVQGGALVDPSTANLPTLVGGTIKLSLIVRDATAPIVIGFTAKGTKSPVINSLPIAVTQSPAPKP